MIRRWVALSLMLCWPRLANAESLTLEAAVKLALHNNERGQKAELRVKTAEAGLERARDAFLPTLSAGASSSWRPDVKAGANPASNGTLTLTQPILSPSSFPQYAQQKHNLESERWGSQQDQRQLAFDTAKAFIQALTAENVLASAQRKLQAAQLSLETARARSQAGLASTNDATKAELQLATSQGQVESAQGNVQKAYIALSFLVAEKVEGPLIAPDNTTNAAKSFEQAPGNQVKNALERREHALAMAQARRPDVRSMEEKNAGLEASADEPLYRLIPSLNASGQLRFNPEPLGSEKALDESVSLNLSWQIFDSGTRYADRKQRVAQLESSKLDEKLLRRSVENDVQLALATLRTARANYSWAEQASVAARKNAEETKVLYDQGLARAIEVSDASDQQFNADVTQAAAKLAMEQAYLDLRSALGFGPLDERKATASR